MKTHFLTQQPPAGVKTAHDRRKQLRDSVAYAQK